MLVHNKGKYVRHRGTVRVLPGVNDMKEKDWKHFIGHPMNAQLHKNEEIIPLNGGPKTEEVDATEPSVDELTITGIDAKEAIEVAKDTFSIELLKEFKADEESSKKRSTVLEAINAQIKELTEDPEDNAEGGE